MVDARVQEDLVRRRPVSIPNTIFIFGTVTRITEKKKNIGNLVPDIRITKASY